MPDFKRCNIETVGIAPAQKYTEMVDAKWQRKRVDEHVDKLGAMMDAKEFLTGHLVIACMPDGSFRNANGQHTLAAILKTGKPQRCLVEWYNCRDDEDYARLFHCYDTEIRKRTWLDNAKAYIMGNTISGDSVSPTQLNQFRGAVEYLMMLYHEEKQPVTRYGRFDATQNYPDELLFFIHLDEIKCDRTLLYKIPVISAIIGTVRAGGQIAREFWNQVMTGFFEKPDINHPAYRLHQYLRGVSIQGGGGSTKSFGVRTGSKFQTQFDVFCACVRCWNAFGRGDSLSTIRGSVRGKVPTIYSPDQLMHAA